MINAREPKVIREVRTSIDITNDILFFAISLLEMTGRIVNPYK